MDSKEKVSLKRQLESPLLREEFEDEANVSLSQHLEVNSKMKEKIREHAEKNRERNREHAKKTRQRKKEMIEGMKIRLLELQKEAGRLEQLIEESDTASILLGLGSRRSDDGNSSGPVSSGDSTDDLQENLRVSQGNIIDHLRQKVRAEAAQTVKEKNESIAAQNSEDDQLDDLDEKYVSDEADGESDSKNLPEIDANKVNISSSDMKRERNRMHAKLTRDRKKLFTSRMQQTILSLEKRNQMLRNKILGLSSSSSSGNTSDSAPTSSSDVPLHHFNGKKAQSFNGFPQSMDDSKKKSSDPNVTYGQDNKKSCHNHNFSNNSSTNVSSTSNSNSNSGGGTPSTLTMSSASSNHNFLQSLVANGGIPTGVIPVIPVQSTPNGPVSWVPTAAFPWGALSSQLVPNNFTGSGNNNNNNNNNNSDNMKSNSPDTPVMTPALYPVMTSVDGTVLTNVPGLPPLSTNLLQSFYQFQKQYYDNTLLQQQLQQGMSNNSNNSTDDHNKDVK